MRSAAAEPGEALSPSISIALATYNGAKYLRQQLDDLASQSLLPAELVVCDDQSSDNSVAIIEGFAASAPFPVHLHRNPERLGYRANFIKCAGLCNSGLIAFCDQDDRWDRRKLELLASPFRDEEVLLAYHNARVVTHDGRYLGAAFPRSRRGFTRERLQENPWFFAMGFTQMFRRSLTSFDELWPSSRDHDEQGERLAHDRWYFFLASVLGKVVYTPQLLTDYRQHHANTYGLSWFRARLPGLTELWHDTHKRSLRLTAARARAQLLEEVSERAVSQWRDRAADGVQLYRDMVELLTQRARIYDAPKLRQRASAVTSLLRCGGYGRGRLQFTPFAFMLDATLGVSGMFEGVERITRRLTGR